MTPYISVLTCSHVYPLLRPALKNMKRCYHNNNDDGFQGKAQLTEFYCLIIYHYGCYISVFTA